MGHLQFYNLASVFILAFLSTLGNFTHAKVVTNPDNNEEYKLCTSKRCKEAGNEIIDSIDHSVDPCDNFYKHACGGWIKNHPVPEKRPFMSQINVLVRNLQTQMEGLFEEMLQKNETLNSETLRKVRDYYHSCKDLAAIDARGLAPLESIIAANGGWPLTLPSDNWSLNDYNLTLQKIHENYARVAAQSSLFVIVTHPDLLNSSVKLLQLKPPTIPKKKQRFSLPQMNKHGFNPEATGYKKYSRAVARELAALQGFDVSFTKINNDVEKIWKFERSLYKLNARKSRNNLNNESLSQVTTIAKVQKKWNRAVSGHPEYMVKQHSPMKIKYDIFEKINWLETIRNAFNGTGIVIDASERIALTPSNIIMKLAKLLKNYSLRTVVNYVHWHAIDNLVKYTNEKMRTITNHFFEHPYKNNDTDDQRSIYCIRHHKMDLGLSYVYVQKYFTENISLAATDMVSQIQAEIKRQFDQSTWMDDESKLRSKEIIDNVTNIVGYPNLYDEPGKVDEFYSELAIDPNLYFENVVNYNRFNTITLLKELRKPHNQHKTDLAYLPRTVNTFKIPEQISTIFPAAMFQMPFFHPEKPLVLNYASLGAVIGYDIIHGSGIQGGRHNEVCEEKQWWSNSTIAKYNEKANCFVEQYNNYTISEDSKYQKIQINGRKTLRQNIADNTAIKTVLKAYISYKTKYNLEDIRTEELRNYTDMQLYFYALSNRYCMTLRPSTVPFLYKNEVHSPSIVRINGVVSNIPEFSKAFNCSSGRPMNPVKKCVLWE